MKFSEQIKDLRTREKLTQEQFAEKLNITRQAVSNWENERNLPDIEMLILIAQNFHISLDELILGGNDMDEVNVMTDKLVRDGSENRRAKMNMISTIVGGVLMIMGLMCLIIKAFSVEYIDASGILHENFFLLPVGFLFIFSGVLVIIVAYVSFVVKKIRER
mgnify:FL=1